MEVEVGQSYTTRMGRSTSIVSSFNGLDGKPYFRGDNDFVYDKKGKLNPLERRPEDLIFLNTL
jgi:hypothetical protein